MSRHERIQKPREAGTNQTRKSKTFVDRMISRCHKTTPEEQSRTTPTSPTPRPGYEYTESSRLRYEKFQRDMISIARDITTRSDRPSSSVTQGRSSGMDSERILRSWRSYDTRRTDCPALSRLSEIDNTASLRCCSSPFHASIAQSDPNAVSSIHPLT